MSGRRTQTRACGCGSVAARVLPQIRGSEARCRAKSERCGNCGTIGVYGTGTKIAPLPSRIGLDLHATAADLTQGASIPYAEPNPGAVSAAERLPQPAAACRNHSAASRADTPRVHGRAPVVRLSRTYVHEGEAHAC